MNDIIKNHRAFVANQIEKSFDSGISVPQELDIEKAKWKVGDEKQYQGATWVVGGFNAKGTPLWRKKKDSGAPAGGSGSAAPATQSSAPAQKTPASNNSSVNVGDQVNVSGWFRPMKIVEIKRGSTVGSRGNIVRCLYALTEEGHVISNIDNGRGTWRPTRWTEDPNFEYEHKGKKYKNPFTDADYSKTYGNPSYKGDDKKDSGNATPAAASTQTQAKQASSSSANQSTPQQTAAKQTTTPAASQTSKTSTPKKHIPFKDLRTHQEVFDYAKTLSGVKFKEVKSGFGDKNSKAFVLSYPSGLELKIDFLNNNEYVYNFSKDGDTILDINSTRNNWETDWSVMLDPNKFASELISNISSSIGKHKSMATRYERIYRNSNKSSDFYKYSNAASIAHNLERRRAAAQKILQL